MKTLAKTKMECLFYSFFVFLPKRDHFPQNTNVIFKCQQNCW